MAVHADAMDASSMFVTRDFVDYSVLDTGDGMKLERWGEYVLARPDPQVIWPKQKPELWRTADAVYHRSSKGGGSWEFFRELPERWTIRYKDLSFFVRPTGFKHTGLFPEQACNWDYMAGKIRERGGQPSVLNLFGYTGAATLACALAGARVTHIDAARSINGWAKENLALSGLENRPVRILADDCIRFVEREARRGHTYDGIVMDPPSYGRSADGRVFRTEDNLAGLIEKTAAILSDNPMFFIVNSYTTNLSSVVTSNLIHMYLDGRGGDVDAGDLCLPVLESQLYLPCGTTARWSPR